MCPAITIFFPVTGRYPRFRGDDSCGLIIVLTSASSGVQIAAEIDHQVAVRSRPVRYTSYPARRPSIRSNDKRRCRSSPIPQQGANVPDAETPNITTEAAADGVSRFEKAVEILTRDQHWAAGAQMIESPPPDRQGRLVAATTAPRNPRRRRHRLAGRARLCPNLSRKDCHVSH